jgi:hypothetical protein
VQAPVASTDVTSGRLTFALTALTASAHGLPAAAVFVAAWVVAVVVGGVDVVPLLPHAESAGRLTISIPVVRTSEYIRIFMIVTVGT